MKKKITQAFLLLSLLTLAVSCGGGTATNSSTKGVASIICDVSFQNILDEEIEVFEYTYRDANILARYLTDAEALDSLLKKKVDLIITARDLTDEQRDILKKQGRAHRSRMIAVDAVAIIVNPKNDINQLSEEELGEIFTGKYRKWNEVTPTQALRGQDIQVVFDRSGSGVVHYIQDKFLNGGDFGMQVYAQGSPEEVFKLVEKNINAIGFIGVSWITADMKGRATSIDERVEQLKNSSDVSAIDFTDRIKVMPVRADDQLQPRAPYQYYINNGEYPLVRKIFAIDASAAGTLDHGFYSFLTGVIGQKIILQTGVLPGAEPVRMVDVSN